MAFVLRGMQEVTDFFNKYEDRRTANWFLMSSPFYTLGICLCYVIIVKNLGPHFMKSRQPFQLRKILIVYNLFQVLFNIWLFYRVSSDGWLSGNYNWRCQPGDDSDKPATLRLVEISWWYYISKFSDFFDTFFFVLTKKFGHISTLHVIHHGVMPLSVWFGVKLLPTGHGSFFGFLNTFVHIVMYTYYMLSAFGPKIQKYLWWKKYLTVLQMIQFVGIIIHAFQLLFIECDYPRGFVWFIGSHAIMFFLLFKEFYNNAYVKDKLPIPSTSSYNGQTVHKIGTNYQQNHQFRRSSEVDLTKRNGHTSDYYLHGNIPMDIQRDVKSQ